MQYVPFIFEKLDVIQNTNHAWNLHVSIYACKHACASEILIFKYIGILAWKLLFTGYGYDVLQYLYSMPGRCLSIGAWRRFMQRVPSRLTLPSRCQLSTSALPCMQIMLVQAYPRHLIVLCVCVCRYVYLCVCVTDYVCFTLVWAFWYSGVTPLVTQKRISIWTGDYIRCWACTQVSSVCRAYRDPSAPPASRFLRPSRRRQQFMSCWPKCLRLATAIGHVPGGITWTVAGNSRGREKRVPITAVTKKWTSQPVALFWYVYHFFMRDGMKLSHNCFHAFVLDCFMLLAVNSMFCGVKK